MRRFLLGFPSDGKAKSARRNRAARIANKHFLPRIQKLFQLCTTALSLPPPVAPVLRGVSGGGDALSSLCRRPFLRRHNESHFAAQSPECAFLAKPFFAQAKNGVNLRRRSHKISVDKAKTNRSHHQITVTPAPRSDSLPFPYTAAWLSELCGVSDPPAG